MLPLGWGSPQYQYSLGNKGLKAMLWRLLLEENLDMSWLCALAAQNPAVEMGLVGRDRKWLHQQVQRALASNLGGHLAGRKDILLHGGKRKERKVVSSELMC